MKIKFEDECPFCGIPVKSYEEFVPHMEERHPDDYLLMYCENNIIEIIQVDSIEEIRRLSLNDILYGSLNNHGE